MPFTQDLATVNQVDERLYDLDDVLSNLRTIVKLAIEIRHLGLSPLQADEAWNEGIEASCQKLAHIQHEAAAIKRILRGESIGGEAMAKISTRNRTILQTRARQLLDDGNDEAAASAIMVAEGLCSQPVARGILQWVIAYNWPAPQSKRRLKKT
jgi:hypothetical protein